MIFERDSNCDSPYFTNVSKVTYITDTDLQTFTYLGYSYIIFVFDRTEFFDHNGKQQPIPEVILLGPGDFFNTRGYKGAGSIAIELPAQTIHIATGKPASELRNVIIDIKDLIPADIVDRMHSKLRVSTSFEEIKSILIDEIESELKQWNTQTKSSDVVKYIHEKKGLVSKQEIADLFCFSERTLERIFMKEVGTSPYLFISQIRFNNALQDLQLMNMDFSQLMLNYNYYDRSHFEKDFEKFMGKRIIQYKNGIPSLFEAALDRSYHKN
ncbi:MAG: AraC family transcriptional regulator [Flavobacteriales bacterium]|nr:AraC family transcriptional regulator [Flavobacteriales bacterium]